MEPNSAVIHAQCRKEITAQREDYEVSLSALMHQRNLLRREKESITQQRNTLEGALEKCRADLERLRHEREMLQQIERENRAKSKNEISRLRETLSSVQADREQQQTEYSRQNKRVFSLTQENHLLSQELETRTREAEGREQEERALLSELDQARRGVEQLSRERAAAEEDRRMLEIELDGLRKERQGLQDTLRSQIEATTQAVESLDPGSHRGREVLRGMGRELSRALECAVTSSYNSTLSSTCSSYSVTTSRDEIPNSGGDLRSLLEELQQKGRGSSASVGGNSRSRSSSLSGSEKKLTERLNMELTRFKEHKDGLSMKIADLKNENQSISEKLLRENRQNELFRGELQELQRQYDQCATRLEKKEQEAIRLNGQLDALKSERDQMRHRSVSDEVCRYERGNPFSGRGRPSKSWLQETHEENSFTMVSELTDPSATLAGLSVSITANDTTTVQIDETITSNLPPRVVPYSVQGPSPELRAEEPEPARPEKGELEAAQQENSELRAQLARARERRPASQLFERISQMEAEKEQLVAENGHLRDELRHKCPGQGEGLQERNQHLSSKLVEAVRLLETHNKEKRKLMLRLFSPEEASSSASMSDVITRVEELMKEMEGLRCGTGEEVELEVLRERMRVAESDNLELTHHLAEVVGERERKDLELEQLDTLCRGVREERDKLSLAHTQLAAEGEEVSAELRLAREAYAELQEERDNLALHNEQLTSRYQEAVECKDRVIEEHAVTLAQLDGMWRLRAESQSPRSRTPTHVWGDGWDRRRLVVQLAAKQDPALYLVGGRDQPLLPNPNAVLVVDVFPGSPASQLVHPGDILESIDSCDCSLLAKSEILNRLSPNEAGSAQLVILRRRGPHKLLVVTETKPPPPHHSQQRSSGRNQLSASASFPGPRSLDTPIPGDFLDNKISQVSLTSSLASHVELTLPQRESNPLTSSSLSPLPAPRSEQVEVVLISSRDSKAGFGFSYSWESQFMVSALTKSGPAISQLKPGDKIVKVNGVSVLQAKPSSVKRLFKSNKSVLKLSLVRCPAPPGSSTSLGGTQDIFSDTELAEPPPPPQQEKEYHSACETRTEEKGFIRNRLSLMRSKKKRKASLSLSVESDTEEPAPAPEWGQGAISKIKAVRVLRLKKKQHSFRAELEPHREDSGEDRRTHEDTRHPLHGRAVEQAFQERKVDCPTTPSHLQAVQFTDRVRDSELACSSNHTDSPAVNTTRSSTHHDTSSEEEMSVLLSRDASGRTTFRNLPDLDRKLAYKRHSLTSAPSINQGMGESNDAIEMQLVSRSAEIFTSNKESPISAEHIAHQPQRELSPVARREATSSQGGPFGEFRSISPLSLQRSIMEKKLLPLVHSGVRERDLDASGSSSIDQFIDEARALVCPTPDLPATTGWQDKPSERDYVRANFTIQGHQFLTVAEGTVYQILDLSPPKLPGFMAVAPVFPEEVLVREGHIPKEETAREMLQNLNPNLDMRALRVYAPVNLYKGSRPVLIFGPLSGEIGQQLEKAYPAEFVVCPKAFVRANDEQMKDQLCSDIAKGLILDLTANAQKNYMFFELDYIQSQIGEGKHSLLSSSPKIIEQLKEKGIPPIAVLIRARSPNTIMSFSSRKLSEKDCALMYQAFEHLDLDLDMCLHSTLMLVKMPVLVEQIREVVQREQGLPVWMDV